MEDEAGGGSADLFVLVDSIDLGGEAKRRQCSRCMSWRGRAARTTKAEWLAREVVLEVDEGSRERRRER
jgi:hypothetical protein